MRLEQVSLRPIILSVYRPEPIEIQYGRYLGIEAIFHARYRSLREVPDHITIDITHAIQGLLRTPNKRRKDSGKHINIE